MSFVLTIFTKLGLWKNNRNYIVLWTFQGYIDNKRLRQYSVNMLFALISTDEMSQ